ncbi:lipopolysaccharide biosynthesis protein [Aliarcobacter butzleri]|uniref:lipopolysaccharide biosynthesis protein n=1 Tax=Aliarcobacter butzleri TaxID=28197 RepID=UPI00125F6047|nr:oligosaccharide flippase family protein [Aliarcobacter butzleri]
MINKLKPWNPVKVKSEFSRNVLTLMTGTTIAQAIPIAISPILTRMYTPEEFGVFALYLSIIMLFSSLVAGKYELSILIPKHEKDAKSLVLLSISISFIVSLVLFIITLIFIEQIISLLKNNDIRYWLYLAPINIFIISTVSILYYYNNRNKNYRSLSSNQILQSSTQGFTNIIFGFITSLKSGLILGTFLGNVSSFFYLIFKTKKYFKDFSFNKYRLYILSKKYIKFPKFMIVSGFLENLSAQLPVFMISSFFGSYILGLFSLSQRIVKVPLGIIGSSIGNVFRQEAAKHLNENGTCRKLFVNTLKKLLIISTIPFILFYFIAPELFGFVFGKEWYKAGEYAQILTILFYFQFITSPLSNMFMIAQKQQYDLILQIYLVISVFCSFIIGYKIFNSIEYSLYIFTTFYSIKYFIELTLSYKFTLK